MQFSFALTLPRDRLSVPVVRQLMGQAMSVLGVLPECVSDLQVAITEACSNVLEHSGGDTRYDVSFGITDSMARIEVTDSGRGFRADDFGRNHAPEGAEGGRGIQLMRALVDKVHFSGGTEGTTVYLEKHLEFAQDAPLIVLTST